MKDFEDILKQKRSVYSCWQTTEEADIGYLISAAELQSWLVAELESPKKHKNGQVSSSSNDSDSDCVRVVAQSSVLQGRTSSPGKKTGDHDKNVKMQSKSRAISATPKDADSPATVSKIGDDVRAGNDNLCDEEMPVTGGGNMTPETRKKYLPEEQPSFSPARIHSRVSSVIGNTIGPTIPSSDGIMVHAETIKAPPTFNGEYDLSNGGIETDKLLDSSSYVCPHGKLDIKCAGQVKRVSQVSRCHYQIAKVAFDCFEWLKMGVMALRELGVEITPDLTTQGSLCGECVWHPYAERSYGMHHRSEVIKFKTLNKGQKDPCWISKQWLADWMKDKPLMHQAGEDVDPAPDSGIFRKHTICKDGSLEPDPSNRQLITERVCGRFFDHSSQGKLILGKCSKSPFFRLCSLDGTPQVRTRWNVSTAKRHTISRKRTRSAVYCSPRQKRFGIPM